MARPRKSKTETLKDTDEAASAAGDKPEIEVAGAPADAPSEAAKDDVVEAAPSGDAMPDEVAAAEEAAPAMTDDAGIPDAPEPEPEPQPQTAPEREPQPVSAATPAPRGPGFFPLALGGAVAAGLSFGAAAYVLPPYLKPSVPPEQIAALVEQVRVQSERAEALAAEIETLKADPAADAQAARVEKVSRDVDALRETAGTLDDRLVQQAQRLSSVDARLNTVEKRPVADGAASATALTAFGREMAELRDQVEAQRLETKSAEDAIAAAVEAATARIKTAEDEAASLHEEAEAAARSAAMRGAVGRLRAALETGTSLGDGLAELKAAGVEVPPALAEQEQGVPSVAALRDAFPPAARAALAASLKETAGGGTWDRVGAFFRSQSGARSLSPRAGDDPDAVLSRAEAALGAGDLAMAITEIAALPETGQARMAEWVTLANRHIAASDAVAALAESME